MSTTASSPEIQIRNDTKVPIDFELGSEGGMLRLLTEGVKVWLVFPQNASLAHWHSYTPGSLLNIQQVAQFHRAWGSMRLPAETRARIFGRGVRRHIRQIDLRVPGTDRSLHVEGPPGDVIGIVNQDPPGERYKVTVDETTVGEL